MSTQQSSDDRAIVNDEYPVGALALITGGGGGLGAACAELLRHRGVRVCTVDLNPGADYQCDISDEQQVADLRQRVVEDGKSVDILINSAGLQGPESALADTEYRHWQQTMRVNVDGVFLMCKYFAPGMIAAGWGRIINLASIAGKEGNAFQSAYSASKAAVIGLTKSLGKELAQDGVLVNAIAPTIISTPLNQHMDPRTQDRLMERIPMGRPGHPDEAAELVAWLASNRCSFSTGAVYDLSGGRATY
ncbi:SDR family NAD(P)-dependent oxidoreductase [Enteractinococcus coprophilus]|uniref:3-oxoacyl-[acyl-carrier protein] reductase n=1 Tax=Enteractinococcus coprophilus TaxID=1027633 RepID=A0A543ANW3_9MICC|nr:SDR family oxidoreductase [Enteractinococcus coprophilus]TQL74267.1 3-oxoacyl-[acyl-carrier protein] reductase [Enteractinococcus coprophilus]